jgi:MinD superfamily P-loop ATPase
MKICVASGKGGTGKTTVAASLAEVWPRPACVADLDVESPNLHLFVRPTITRTEPVRLEVPRVDRDACDGCRACVDACQFEALAVFEGQAHVFPEMCHGCGGCFRACPKGALRPGERELGVLELGATGRGQRFAAGRQHVGEAMSTPIIGALVREAARPGVDALMDAPPGVSCPAMTAAGAADQILLVAEPTPFGLHDLGLAVAAFAQLARPMAAVINRAGVGDDGVARFLREAGIPILGEIPYDRRWAEAYGRGEPLAAHPEMRARFEALIGALLGRADASPALLGRSAVMRELDAARSGRPQEAGRRTE